MIKTLIAWTAEVDDDKLAVEQIKSQLGLEGGLLRNTVGIVACHYEFVLSGILKAICEALPFDVDRHVIDAAAHSAEENLGFALQKGPAFRRLRQQRV